MNATFVTWLNALPRDFPALMDVTGTDFKADCILIKPQGILNIRIDPYPYSVANKDGFWKLQDKSEIANPIGVLEDRTTKIRDFLISVSDKIFVDEDPRVLKEFARRLKVIWVVALTHAYSKGNFPLSSGRISALKTGS